MTLKFNGNKSVNIMENGTRYFAAAMEDGEFWFTIGHFNTLKGAIRSAIRQMAKSGYSLA